MSGFADLRLPIRTAVHCSTLQHAAACQCRKLLRECVQRGVPRDPYYNIRSAEPHLTPVLAKLEQAVLCCISVQLGALLLFNLCNDCSTCATQSTLSGILF